MARNKYPGPCMRCGRMVAVGTGHAQLQEDGTFKVHHANYSGDGRVTCYMVKDHLPANVIPIASYTACMGKVSFETFDDAERAAKRTRECGYGRNMRAYRCPSCHKYHLGHDVIGTPKKYRFKNRRK